jgi:hypothetical protein
MTMTKAQRSAAAKKAAATRKRNQAKGSAKEVERQLKDLRRAGEKVAEGVRDLGKTAGAAAKTAADATAGRAGTGRRRRPGH